MVARSSGAIRSMMTSAMVGDLFPGDRQRRLALAGPRRARPFPAAASFRPRHCSRYSTLRAIQPRDQFRPRGHAPVRQVELLLQVLLFLRRPRLLDHELVALVSFALVLLPLLGHLNSRLRDRPRLALVGLF